MLIIFDFGTVRLSDMDNNLRYYPYAPPDRPRGGPTFSFIIWKAGQCITFGLGLIYIKVLFIVLLMLDGKIYSIVCKTTGKHYVGSTCFTLQKRLKEHEYNYKNKRTCTSWQVLDNNNYEIILLEENKFESRKDLLKREGYYIQKNRNYINRNNCVNFNIPGREEKPKMPVFDTKTVEGKIAYWQYKAKIKEDKRKELIEWRKRVYKTTPWLIY